MFTTDNTAGLQAFDFETMHVVNRPQDWTDAKDAAQHALDCIAAKMNGGMSDAAAPKRQGMDNPWVIGAQFVEVDHHSYMLTFSTADESGYVVTWQVYPL